MQVLLCWLKQNLAWSVFVRIRQRGKGRAKKRCRPANTKQHWACACSRRRFFCFCSSRRSLFTLRLVSRSFAPLARCSCSCSQRWSLLLGIVCALFPCVAPLVALWNQGPLNDQKTTEPTGEACVSSVSVLFRRSVLHDVAFAWSVWFCVFWMFGSRTSCCLSIGMSTHSLEVEHFLLPWHRQGNTHCIVAQPDSSRCLSVRAFRLSRGSALVASACQRSLHSSAAEHFSLPSLHRRAA